ncbi:MAG: PQQ-binding-like beta-propeller repeat protein [Chthoniobacteraceae bacterium]|nr:PQQ-binding-like beta-propeller repeat protein [Chthoniobacteraceae bacterium]
MHQPPFVLALAAALLLAGNAHAADWPQWGGSASKNMVSEEINLPETFTPGEKKPQGGGIDLATAKNVKWAVPMGTFTCSAPAVAGGKVFMGGLAGKNGVLYCFEEATGKLLWQWTKPCRKDITEDPAQFLFFRTPEQLGVCSTPAVDGDRLYFVDQNCAVVCLDVNGQPPAPGATAGEARELWTFDLFADPNVGSRPADVCNGSPVIDGDFLYVPTSNGVDRFPSKPIEVDGARRGFAPNAPSLVVLDKNTGRLLAKDDAPIGNQTFHGQWSSPSVGLIKKRPLVFFGGGDGICYAFQALVKAPKKPPVPLVMAWWMDCVPPEYRSLSGKDRITDYALGDRRRADTLNKKNDGTFEGPSEIIGTPVFYNNRVYVAIGRDPQHGRGRGALVCADATKSGDITQTGKIWTYQGLDRTLSTVSIANGLLYIADVAGRVHCLDAETGAVQWVYETNSKTLGSTLVADGKVYLQTEKYLFILAAGKETKLLGKVNLGAPSWITPVAANGTVYVASEKYLWALKP